MVGIPTVRVRRVSVHHFFGVGRPLSAHGILPGGFHIQAGIIVSVRFRHHHLVGLAGILEEHRRNGKTAGRNLTRRTIHLVKPLEITVALMNLVHLARLFTLGCGIAVAFREIHRRGKSEIEHGIFAVDNDFLVPVRHETVSPPFVVGSHDQVVVRAVRQHYFIVRLFQGLVFPRHDVYLAVHTVFLHRGHGVASHITPVGQVHPYHRRFHQLHLIVPHFKFRAPFHTELHLQFLVGRRQFVLFRFQDKRPAEEYRQR